MIVVHAPLKVFRGVVITICGGFLLIGGLFALTGHGLSLPYFYSLGGSEISLMGSVYVTIIGFVFVLLGTAELLDRPAGLLYRRELTEILKSMTTKPDSHPDEREAARVLLNAVNSHRISQEIKKN